MHNKHPMNAFAVPRVLTISKPVNIKIRMYSLENMRRYLKWIFFQSNIYGSSVSNVPIWFQFLLCLNHSSIFIAKKYKEITIGGNVASKLFFYIKVQCPIFFNSHSRSFYSRTLTNFCKSIVVQIDMFAYKSYCCYRFIS